MSEFPFHCPHCGQLLTAMDDLVGEQVDCPNPLCARELTVPARDEADTPPLKSSKGGFGSSFGSSSANLSSGSGSTSGGSPGAARSFSKRKPVDAAPPPVPAPPGVPTSGAVPPPVPEAGETAPEEDDGYELSATAPASPPPLPSQLGAPAASDDWGADGVGDAGPKTPAGDGVSAEYKSPAHASAYDYGDMPAQTEMLSKVSLGLGIGSIALMTVCCCSIFSTVLSMPLAIAAIVCGIMSIRNIRAANGVLTGEPLAKAGIVCGGVSILLSLFQIALVVLQLAWAMMNR